MKQFGKIALAILPLFVFLVVKSLVFAAAQISVSNVPLTIDQSQEFNIDISFSCPGCGDSYLRGVFYPSGSSYFGFTQDNSGGWSNAPGGSCTTYFKIAQTNLTPEGSWSGKLKFKPDIGSSYYSGPGEYMFKVGRYTPSCSSPSVWSSESTIAVTGPTPTPTSSPTQFSTSTPTLVKTPIPTPTAIPVTVSTAIPTDVLGESTDSADLLLETLTPIPTKQEVIRDKNTQVLGENNFPKIMISLGIIFSSACGILAFRAYKKRKNEIRNL